MEMEGGAGPISAELRADRPRPVRVLIILQYCLLVVYCCSPRLTNCGTPQSVGPFLRLPLGQLLYVVLRIPELLHGVVRDTSRAPHGHQGT